MSSEFDATYDYKDEQGDLLYQVVRKPGKQFRQRRPNGKGGWIWDLDGVARVIYRLPRVLDHIAINSREPLYIAEGEKDVEALEQAGAVATCNPGGAGKWSDEYSETLKSARCIVIVADRDETGRKHARAVRDSLALVGVTDVTIVEAADGKDAADHLANGYALDAFVNLPEATRLDLSDLTVDEILAANPDLTKEELFAQNPNLKALLAGKESQATVLVNLALDGGATLFHDSEPRPYMTFEQDGCMQTWPVRSRVVKLHLRRLYHEAHDGAVAAQSVTDAIATLEAKAVFQGAELDVYLRVAPDGDAIVVDLGDAAWKAVRISAGGWTVLERHPVRFRRARGLASLPEPVRDGDLSLLRPFLNLATEDDWRLVVAWLLAALRPPGHPYPVLGLHGEQGSAKSTTARVLRQLTDPSTVPLRAAPHSVHDLMISANAGWVISLDNLSSLPPWLSDALCRLSTGGGFTTRELYSDDDETLFDAQRPVIVNGVEELATRSDLLDRSLLIQLPTIPPGNRIAEHDFWADFEQARPRILGALYDAVACALANVGSTKLERLPRMADFALWVTAAEQALGWEPHSFIDAYERNRSQAHELAIEANVIGPALLAVAGNGFEGTATDLLKILTAMVDDTKHRPKDWPKSAQKVSGELKRLAPNLRALGITVKRFRKPGSGDRLIAITKNHVAPAHATEPSQLSQPSRDADESDIPATGNRHAHVAPQSHIVTASHTSVTSQQDRKPARDGRDGCDSSAALPELDEVVWPDKTGLSSEEAILADCNALVEQGHAAWVDAQEPLTGFPDAEGNE